MEQFLIYHPVQGMNHFCNTEDEILYKGVAVVNAESFENAFTKAQNDFNPLYEAFKIRSTSVGDIIRSTETGKAKLVMGMGWKDIGVDLQPEGLYILPENEDAASIADRTIDWE